jgi:subtilisin family serine protease
MKRGEKSENEHLITCRREDLGRDAWDAFVDSADEAWLWHVFDLQDAVATWPGKHDLSFALVDRQADGEVVAVMPLHLIKGKRMGFLNWHVLDSIGGPACSNSLGKKYRQRVLQRVMEEMVCLAKEHRAVEITLSLPPMSPARRGERCPRVNPLLVLGCENTLTQTWVVNLQTGKDQVWANMEGRARTAIRKAEKLGVDCRPAGQAGDLDIYYNLHCETYKRTGVRPHPRAYFEAIWRNFLKKNLSYILFAKWHGTVVAAENFGIYKQAAVYWTGAASAQGLVMGANSLLQWRAMQWMIDNGLEWYETGEAFPQVHSGKLKGLNDFKKSFGGVLLPTFRGRMVLRKKIHSLMNCYRIFRGA